MKIYKVEIFACDAEYDNSIFATYFRVKEEAEKYKLRLEKFIQYVIAWDRYMREKEEDEIVYEIQKSNKLIWSIAIHSFDEFEVKVTEQLLR